MPNVLRASLKPVLDAVEARLAAKTAIPAGRIRQLARHQKNVPHFDGDQDVLLRVRGFAADQQHRDRHDCRIVRRLSVVLRTRLELDEAGGDESYLGDAVGGAIIREEDIIDALQDFTPADGEDNLLTYESVYVLSGDDHLHAPQEGWGEVELLFALPLTLPLEQRED